MRKYGEIRRGNKQEHRQIQRKIYIIDKLQHGIVKFIITWGGGNCEENISTDASTIFHTYLEG